MTRSPVPPDTDIEAFDRMVDMWRSMSIAERAALVDQLSLDVVALSVAGVRLHQPDLCDGDLLHEVARRRFGSQLADAAYGRSTP